MPLILDNPWSALSYSFVLVIIIMSQRSRSTSPGRAPVNPTDFNPFAALSLHPQTATPELLCPAYRAAMRHRHEGVVLRHPATANNFPLQVQVQQAYDYLKAGQIVPARARWGSTHRVVFNSTLPVGDPNVFPTTLDPRPASPLLNPTPASATQTWTDRRPTPPFYTPSSDDRIIVGEWARSRHNPRNAVAAWFRTPGLPFYQIQNTDLQGNPVKAPRRTTTCFDDIIFRAPYQRTDQLGVRDRIHRDLHLPPDQRP